ncbi:hypothetical protein N836_32575 [Leptolyngbya sp. Heron Island J]|uniref:hypothetical protein n=1 Tax=Leptolyngbya sp. Heron Island J TaxID=1385935 RepID=UPI0003B9C01B|nr:hypothetical protein [Leptolyngbya sp. Heron Island J]ESA38169.1 hypothetical protein N836_32575 [Leptolyngbya sp. Heron Island J]
MKTKQLLTQDLATSEITVISNHASVTVAGTKVARVEEIPGHEQENPSMVHVDFKVKNPSRQPELLDNTEDLGLILKLNDAVDLGLLLVAMGVEHKTPEEIKATMARLSKLIDEFS